jgi:hypothetical protein
MLGTMIAVSVGTQHAGRRQERRATHAKLARYNQVAKAVAPFAAWFDGLSDAEAYAYAGQILGQSRGSRYADREALVAYHAARVF